MFRILRYFLIGIAIFLSATGCRKSDEKRVFQQKPSDEKRNEKKNLPDYILGDVTHYHYEDESLKLKIDFENGSYYNSNDDLWVENCKFIYYNIDRKAISEGSSRKARLIESNSKLVAERNVVVISNINQCKLETEYLEWQSDSNQFFTDRFVKVTRPNGDMLTGIGLTADIALRVVTIKSNVKGYFKENQK